MNRTDYQLIDISEDGFVSRLFCSVFSSLLLVVNSIISLLTKPEPEFATKLL